MPNDVTIVENEAGEEDYDLGAEVLDAGTKEEEGISSLEEASCVPPEEEEAEKARAEMKEALEADRRSSTPTGTPAGPE